MKKLIILLLIILGFIGCMSTNESLYKLPTNDGSGSYDIGTTHYEDIEGNFYFISSPVYDSYPLFGDMEYVMINKSVSENRDSYYFISIYYTGEDWRFMEDFKFKIDGDLFTITDKDPSRNVGVGLGVSERLMFLLSTEIINRLLNAETIVMQYYATPITLDESQITIIQSFLTDTKNYTYLNNLE